MNILIYGAGAVGGYVAAHLAQAGHRVVAISRSSADRLNEAGFSIRKSDGGHIRVKIPTVSTFRQGLLQAEEHGFTYDHIILGMKSYDLPSAANELMAFAPNFHSIITMQNGIGVEQTLVDHYGTGPVTAGAFTVPVSYDDNLNIIEERGDRGLGLASMSDERLSKDTRDLFKGAGIDTEIIRSYESMKWSKALLNMVGNATSAIINRPPGALYKYKPIFQIETRMLKETLAVMKARGIKVVNLPGGPAKTLERGLNWLPENMLQSALTRQVSRGRGDKMPSFQIDLAAGKSKNEVLYHNGAVHRYGKEAGVPTPVNAALTDILLEIANQEVNWETYDGKPKQFVAAVNAHIRQGRAQQVPTAD